MKGKGSVKRLQLKKETIAGLNRKSMEVVRGGDGHMLESRDLGCFGEEPPYNTRGDFRWKI